MEAPRSLWLRYKKKPTPQLRNQIAAYYQDIIEGWAIHFENILPPNALVEHDHLVSVGWMALAESIDRYDLGRKVKFLTYCHKRIRGRIMDELRDLDWLPRLTRGYVKKLETITENCLQQYGRLPTDKELARKLGWIKEKYKKKMPYHREIVKVSLSRKWFETDSNKNVCEIDIIEDKRAPKSVDNAMKRELKNLLTESLSRAEKLILILYYYEDMTMREIGETLGLSESRVSQMHSSILARLKAQMSLSRFQREIS